MSRRKKHLITTPLMLAILGAIAVNAAFLVLRTKTLEIDRVENHPTVDTSEPVPSLIEGLPKLLSFKAEKLEAAIVTPLIDDFVRAQAKKASSPTEADLSGHELKVRAAKLSAAELESIALLAKDPARPSSERNIGVYLLSLCGERAAPLLASIVLEPVPNFAEAGDPHAAVTFGHDFEISLRVNALEALNRLQTSANAESRLNQIIIGQDEPTLRMLAQIALSGWKSGQPQRLEKMIDRMVGQIPESEGF